MAARQRPSLNSFLAWTNVLPVLGVEVRGSALPATVICPLCQRQALGVYKEPARPGQWYHCSNCGFAGDAVELTAAVGNISLGTATLKLATRGLPIPDELLTDESIERHNKKIDLRKRTMAFWNAARASTHDVGNVGPAHRKLGVPAGATLVPEWSRRGGRFVGHCKSIDVETLLRPGVLDYRLRAGRNGTGNVGWQPLFTGRGWRDLVVVAYQDVPGRVSGLLLIGREANWPEDFVFAPTQPRGKPWSIGVAMLEAALSLHREFGAAVMVIEDPVLAVRIQLRHLIASDTPLPVVGAWGRSELQSIWATLPRRDLIHWSPDPDGRLITRARQSGGKVALTPAGPAIMGHLERSRPLLALRGMLAAARPWDAALESLLSRLSPARAEELVLGLKLRPDETTGFLRACADDTRARLAALFVDVGKPRGVTISGKTVTESGGAWRVARTGELVCDAVLRIEQVVRPTTGDIYYRGRIEYRGQALPFWTPGREIERDTMRWMRTAIGAAGLGEMVMGSKYWSNHLLAIAQQFEPPKAVRGLDAVGWDNARNGFALPRFILLGNGEIVTPDYVVPPQAVLPGADLAPPEGMTPGARVAMAWGDEANELFWAAATCLLTDILAPALGFPRTATAMVGPGAIAVGTATALAFGCATAQVPCDHRSTLPEKTRAMFDVHRWPLLIRRAAHNSTPTISLRALTQIPTGVITATTDWAADTLALAGGWHVIVGSNPASRDRAREHGGTVILSYLKDLCDRHLNLEVTGNLLDAVHADLVDWYGRASSSRVVRGARRYIAADDPTAHPDRFGRLVCRLIACGDLHMAPPGTNDRQVVTLLGEDRVHIPKWSMNERLARRNAIPLDTDAISVQLRAAGVLLEERDQDYVAGWVVSERWLRQHTNDRRQDDSNDLRVITK